MLHSSPLRASQIKRHSRKRLPAFRSPDARRSNNMRAIRATGNKTTEKRLSALLRKHRIRGWRSQPPNILGKPDFAIERERVAIFVDGCFFHGCPRCGHIPRTNRRYWAAKIARNKSRDRVISRALRALGYHVTRIWECQLREHPERCVRRIVRATRLD
jgi:DNA mismatch endonuclease, patch repair protein